MEHMLASLLQGHLKKLSENEKQGGELCEKNEIAMSDIIRLRIALKLNLDNLKSDLVKYSVNCTNINQELVSACVEMQGKAEELLINLETLFEVDKKKREISQSHPSTIKLPTLQLPKFNGNITDFSEFWDRFDSAIGSRDLKEVDKLAYLINCLEGPALEIVKGLATTNENYAIALEVLKNHYGSRNKVIDAHYEALAKLKKATSVAGDCRLTLNHIQRHLRVLNSLGEDTEGNHIRVMLRGKFPEKILYELNVLKGNDCTSKEVLEGLERIITAMESASNLDIEKDTKIGSSTETLHVQAKSKVPWLGRMEYSHQKGRKINHAQKKITAIKEKRDSFHSRKRKLPLSTPAKEDEENKKRRMNCIFCNGNHYNDKCENVKTIEERKKKLGKKCFLCFKEGHFTNRCRMQIKCYHCKAKAKHNSALCPKEHGIKVEFSDIICKDKDKTYSLNVCSKSFLQTATAKVQDNKGNYKDCRLLLDSGSQRSYITVKLANKLELKPDSEDLLLIYTFGSDTPKQILCPSVEIEIQTKREIKKKIRVNIVSCITTKVSVPDVPQSSHIDILADDGSAGQQIDLLIGNNYYFSFIRTEKIQLNENLFLVNTDFGWMMTGSVEANKEEENILSIVTYCQCHRPDCPYFTEPDLPLRSIDIKFLWSLEGIGITDSPKASREEEAVEYFNNTVKYEDGRYQVKWPWIQYPPELPTNYGLAYGRLKGLLKRLDMDTMIEYDAILKEQLEAKIIEEVRKPESPYQQTSPPIHYIAHHMVKQEGKRGRLVYDASAKTKEGKSLNECLYRGPSMLEDLTALLLKFRTNSIGITSDVEKAFLQIGLQEEDRDVCRFLWIKDITKEPTDDNIIHLRFTRVPFGIISSPFLLTASIRHHMSQKDSTLLKEVASKCYVDNLVTGARNRDEAIALYNRTNTVFEELGMNIREWTSNDEEFVKSLPIHKQAKVSDKIKVLGLTWNLKKDTLCLEYKENTEKEIPKTRKEVLRTLARIYDPCGFVAPLILSAKILFQELCRRKLKWDEEIPNDLLQPWENIIENLKVIKMVEIPRYIGIEERSNLELHCFADAAKDCYAAVIYLRGKDRDQRKTTFVMAKSRVTPLEEKDALKIPKLELLGCLIGCRLIKYVKESLAIPIDRQYLWTDSLIVLNWMKSDKLLPPFVAKRIDEIKKHKDIQPCYINTNENPADLATRPELWLKKRDLWFNGPDFLAKEESDWPESRSLDYHRSLLVAGEDQDAHHPELEIVMVDDDDHHEECAQDVVREETNKESKSLEELSEIKKLQQQYFPEEMKGKETHLTRNLGLFLDIDGILRCKGRLSNACWTYDMKHPVLIPKDCEFTNALIRTTHEKNYHVGTAHTLSLIRQQYWIPQGRAQVKKVITKCLQCQKHTTGPYKLPDPPALSQERVNYSSPFTYTGTDYLGPVLVNTGSEKAKRWICLYTCLAIRAVHLEIVQNLTAEECLLALRRFISCRGVPKLVVSDNGSQFKLTSELFSNSFCIENKITWKFIPQLAPWHGGFYERLVALVKNCLKRTLDKNLLNDSQMQTVVKEVEAVVNTRPLTNVGSELDIVLRPSDFLSLGKCLTTTMCEKNLHEDLTTTKGNLIEGWKRGQNILEEFKHMFVNHYLMSLRERYSHSHKQPRVTSPRSPCVGDIVQVKGDTKNRSNWRIGKIIELLKGCDGQCRVAKVKIGDGIFIRSIAHLYPLEIEDNLPVVGEDESQPNDIITRNITERETNVEAPSLQKLPVELPEIQEQSPEPNEELEPHCEMPEFSDNDGRTENVQEETQLENPIEQEEIETVTTPEAEGNIRLEEDRVRRVAAIRAREKIAEWTSLLVALF